MQNYHAAGNIPPWQQLGSFKHTMHTHLGVMCLVQRHSADAVQGVCTAHSPEQAVACLTHSRHSPHTHKAIACVHAAGRITTDKQALCHAGVRKGIFERCFACSCCMHRPQASISPAASQGAPPADKSRGAEWSVVAGSHNSCSTAASNSGATCCRVARRSPLCRFHIVIRPAITQLPLMSHPSCMLLIAACPGFQQ